MPADISALFLLNKNCCKFNHWLFDDWTFLGVSTFENISRGGWEKGWGVSLLRLISFLALVSEIDSLVNLLFFALWKSSLFTSELAFDKIWSKCGLVRDGVSSYNT